MPRTCSAVLLAVTLAFIAPRAHAQPRLADKAAAEALFEEGRRKMSEGAYGEACPRFEESDHLDPTVGTALYLGDCYEKSGKTASGWAGFREAMARANRAGDERRLKTATERARALETKLARLTIVVPRALADMPAFSLRENGRPLGRGSWGLGVPVDPGEHLIEASASGYKPSSLRVAIAPGETRSVEIAPLDPELAAPSPPTPTNVAPEPTPTPPPREPPAPTSDRGTTQRVAGLALGGVGVASLALGAYFGLRAHAKNADAEGVCHDDRCGLAGSQLTDDAKSAAKAANAAFLVGGALLIGGIVVYAVSPRGEPAAEARAIVAAPLLSSNAGGLVLRGVW